MLAGLVGGDLDLVTLRHLLQHRAGGVLQLDQDDEVRGDELALGHGLEHHACRRHGDEDRHEARPIGVRKAQRQRPHRKVVGQLRPIEHGEGRGLEAEDRRAGRRAQGVVALARADARVIARDLHVDGAEAAVVGRVLRHVGQHVVVAHVGVDALEPAAQVVGVGDEEAAGLVGELVEAAVRVGAQQILVLLEGHHHRPVGDVAGRIARHGDGAGLVDTVVGLLGGAEGAQAGRVHRVDADVGPVGRVDDRLEAGLDVGRDGQALGEEHDALAARDRLHRADHRHEGVGGGVALFVPFQRLERLGHAALDGGEPDFGGRAADRRRPATGAGVAGHGVERVGRADQVGRRLRRLLARGVEGRRAAPAGRTDGGADGVGVARERLVEDQRQVDAEHGDHVVRDLARPDVLVGGVERQRPAVGRQPIEDQREDLGGLLRRLARRITGRTGHRGRCPRRRHRRLVDRGERPDLLPDTVLRRSGNRWR